MNKSQLIEKISSHHMDIPIKDVESAVKNIIEYLAQSMENGNRIEIRGFGSFSLRYRAPRTGRNPKTGEQVELSGKHVPHFKTGKEMRDRVNQSLFDGIPIVIDESSDKED